ncbi:MAG: four helix bundle protein [Candidatus Omnitrophota bacterium]
MKNGLKTHRDLDVWKEARKLVKEVYLLTKDFPKEETYGLTSQIRRSVISIPSNIAEGAARNSSKEFIQFLYVALGSLSELETQLLLALDLGYIKSYNLESSIDKQKQMIFGLLRYLKNNS